MRCEKLRSTTRITFESMYKRAFRHSYHLYLLTTFSLISAPSGLLYMLPNVILVIDLISHTSPLQRASPLHAFLECQFRNLFSGKYSPGTRLWVIRRAVSLFFSFRQFVLVKVDRWNSSVPSMHRHVATMCCARRRHTMYAAATAIRTG